MTIVYVIAAVLLLVWGVATWFAANWLGLTGNAVWLFRIGLWLMGLAAAVLAVLLIKKKKSEPAGTGGLNDEVTALSNEANSRLASSQQVRGGGSRISDLPLILFLGEGGSTKTTAIVSSGLEPELIAGQVYQDNAILTTRSGNLWIGAGALFAEASGALLNDASAFQRFVYYLRARGVGQAFGKSQQAPRAVVVCVSAEALTQLDSGSITALARKMQGILGQVAQTLGSRLPVYVLVTKLDRVQFFPEYVRNMTREEANQVFGTTLPLVDLSQLGAYAENETRRIGAAFDTLFAGLAEKRLEYLRRENDAAVSPAVYEFPREFRRTRDNLVKFLVDLGRPSQLRASPFLRGFYFTGVRGVAGDGGRRVPQWVFLQNFFKQTLLEDRVARETSGANAQASSSHRIIGAVASLAALGFLGGATASFFNNRSVIGEARDASQALTAMRPAPGVAPTVEMLRQLERLRVPTEQVTGWERNGAPFWHRWGLYPGTALYDNVRASYCENFRRLLLSDTLTSVAGAMRVLPQTPGPNDSYEAPYSALKSHLLATSHPGKADAGNQAFLAQALSARWAATKNPGDEQLKLARAQFQFYAQERPGDYCPARPDSDGIRNARLYLMQFKLVDRAYRNILDAVGAHGKPVRFLDPAGAVVDRKEVPYAFTKTGFIEVQAAIRKAPDYFDREPWVMGDQKGSAPVQNDAEIVQALQGRYRDEFLSQWTEFLNAGQVTPYASLKDASTKLSRLTEAKTPLMELFCTISNHTAVENPDIVKAFQPIQSLAPPTCLQSGQFIADPNRAYMGKLVDLQIKIDQVAALPANSEYSLDMEAGAAKAAAKVTAQTANLMAKAQKLLEDPIINAEKFRPDPNAKPNAAGAGLCSELNPVLKKFPFRGAASEQIRPDDVNAVFNPQSGRLFAFVNEGLQDVVSNMGGHFAAKAGGKVTPSDAFLAFLNRGGDISKAFFATGGPKLTYTVRALPSPEIESFELTIDGKKMKGSGKGGDTAEFQWPGDGSGVQLSGKGKDIGNTSSSIPGSAALFMFLFKAADRNSGSTYEWDLKASTSIGRMGSSSAAKATLKLQIESKPVNVLRPGAMEMVCTGKVAR